MAIIKLPNEGDTHTMRVTGCEAVQGQYGEQVKFTGEGGDIIFLPKDSADRQLGRIPLEYVTAVGETLTFSRDPNPKKGAKPYWSVTVANPRATQPSKRVQPKEADPSKGLPPSFGGPIKGLDDGPEPDPYREVPPIPAWHKAHPADAEMAGPWDTEGANAPDPLDPNAEPPLTPREERERTEATDKQAVILDTYTELYEAVLARLASAHFKVNQTMTGARATDKVALTSDTAHAATFSIFKRWCDKGLV